MSDDKCGCLKCANERMEGVMLAGCYWMPETVRMYVCAICGNKRCPHSDDHRNACTNSNEPGQTGSRYGVAANA